MAVGPVSEDRYPPHCAVCGEDRPECLEVRQSGLFASSTTTIVTCRSCRRITVPDLRYPPRVRRATTQDS